MKKMVLVFGFVLFFSISFQVNAQNFFPTKQGDVYQLEEVTFHWTHPVIGPYYSYFYSQSVANEVTVNNRTFVWAWNHYYRLDTTLNKLFILLNNEEKIAFDFNKLGGDTDTLYFDGYAHLWIYSDIQYRNIFGENRMVREITTNYIEGPFTWILADGIGIYRSEFTNNVGYFDIKETVISAIIDDSVYNPITLDLTAYFPNKISRNQSSFSFLVDIDAEYIGLVDSLNANVIAYNSDSLIYQNTFIGSIDLEKIIINMPSQILSQADSVGIRVHCTDESIFNNNVFVPELGHKFIYVEDESEWSLFTPTISGTSFMGMKFFSANKGYIYKYSGDIFNMIFYDNLTTDGGQSFNSSYGSSGYWSINSIISLNQNTGYMIRERLLKTTDQGGTWVYILNHSLNAMSFIDVDTGWVSSDYEPKIYRTYNGGSNWEMFNTGLQEPFRFVAFAQLNEGYAVTSNTGKIYRSADNGESWQFTNTTIASQRELNVFREGKGWLIGDGIWRTEDGGFNWTQQLEGNFVDAHFFNKDKGWVIGKVNETNVLLRTIDGGNNWSEVGAPYTQGDYWRIDFVDELHGWIYAYSWTSNELLRTTNGGVTFIEEENNFTQPKEFLLQQNYPNPFNPSTKIIWQSPVGSWQTLKVYDILGNEVATLVNDYRNAGNYEVDFQSTVGSHQLANGVYFYQLRVGDFVETKKMILLK